MEKIYLVYDEYSCESAECRCIIPCATMEVAVRKIKVLLEWYLKNTYLDLYVDDNLNVNENMLFEYDIWEVEPDRVEIFIADKNISLNLHIAESDVIDE